MLTEDQIHDLNQPLLAEHHLQFDYLADLLARRGQDAHQLILQLVEFQVAIPSWALGTGGTRFGRFPAGGEPRSLEEKIGDVGLLNQLNGSSNSISLHIPWDIPQDIAGLHQLLKEQGLSIDSMNSNTFQDQKEQAHTYKFGSLSATDRAVREQAIQHNIDCIRYGTDLGAKVHTVWLADGSNFPGQSHLRRAYLRTQESLAAIYEALPSDWTMLIEYKPYEPNFYSMVIPDWGTSYTLCQSLGQQAQVLVDLGHHLPNTNIEQIVGRLRQLGRLGGFHFNGSGYGDDDLTTGSAKPFQLFLIFNELVDANQDASLGASTVAYMIDASHNTKDPLEDLLQSVDNILGAYAKALLVDRAALQEAQEANDTVRAEEILRDAFLTDVRPLVAEAYRQSGGALHPVRAYRAAGVRQQLIAQRGKFSLSTGL
ncbi:TIM barrel protein [Hymenobacter sp. BT559]|uniref:TIM barrel protein n=1 Tax=Hymenobacter sp. BT559 TaxID=2795729 RepID=UPI0018EB3679|nr:TIM barrel protein [Hymenobacter sp. BT559]MBJ6144883.1 sugar isomerase [Hymenobacter sp. BT559]